MIDPFLAPIIAGDALLMPRATYWPKHGWRCEIVIDDLAGGDAIISDFFETRAEATRWADVAILRAAERYAGCAAQVSRPTVGHYEAGRTTPIPNNLAAMVRALESAGIQFGSDGSIRLSMTTHRAGATRPNATFFL